MKWCIEKITIEVRTEDAPDKVEVIELAAEEFYQDKDCKEARLLHEVVGERIV